MGPEIRIRKLVGARIKSLRESKGYTQDKLAEKIDRSRVYLSSVERGNENPTLDLLIRISIALDVDLADLLDYKHEINSKALKEALRKCVDDVEDEDKLKTLLRVMKAVVR